ncbi:UDP-3-O-(3-hydroxymyristoyl)glucosamine N-acyltransferase [Vibrio alfacsensis]|uniref:UDP-3-O-(3-hydroxymyristoyl)glucosamine N-acyltransferase n=1 Tax=Vibrio alfacsensis TaxID=1074311 RepID=A0ABM6YVW2_9VIBR|nr:UDP-3-O-(3-hydroxymyristoyl)glucosamine N-acyltransferase [Vibrio alfacsensis]AXY01984.1 UDP-3-O-(3-hydroxymyristoyl)glucosamine N-acyltransferase [Vibrio alfacsensis]
MIKVTDIATLLNGVVKGNPELSIDSIVELTHPSPGGLAIVRQPSDLKKIKRCLADVIIGPESICQDTSATVIIIDRLKAEDINALLTWYKVQRYRLDDQENTSEIADVYIGKHTTIGDNCHFKPGVKIMNGVTIGNNVAIHANTVIKEGTVIGDNVTIDSNCSIGNYSFEYLNDEKGQYVRLESVGRVIIENNVEIGCNNAIDRGTLGDTVIGLGTKLDNLIQIGHDVKIGQNCLLVSQVGIAGWTIIEDNVLIHGQVGITGGVTIGQNSRIKAQAGVTRSCPANSHLSGYPARETNEYLKTLAALNNLVKSRKKQPAASQQAVDSQLSWLRRIFNL